MGLIKLIVTGIIIGMCNVIPGVSGGTMAVVFNIYDKFVNAITFNLKKLKANWKFIVPLLGGMAAGVLLFSKLITVLYGKFPVQTNYFFCGLIIGSLPLLFNYMLPRRTEGKNSVAGYILMVVCAAAGFCFLLWFSSLESGFDKSAIISELPSVETGLMVRIFIAGILGAVAMIVPGISGSLIMLIMGVYPIVIAAIPALFDLDKTLHALILLLPNGIGVLMGLVGGAKLISLLIKVAEKQTYAVIFGLICASLVSLFPGFSGISGAGAAIGCVVCLLAGAALAFFTTKFAPEDEGKEEKAS